MKKILIDMDVVYVAEVNKNDPRHQEAKQFMKEVDKDKFYVYTLDEQITTVAEWNSKEKRDGVIERFIDVRDAHVEIADILKQMEKNIGRDIEGFLDEFVDETQSKRVDLRLVLACSQLEIDYLVTFNKQHLRGKAVVIEEFLEKHNLFVPAIVFPKEVSGFTLGKKESVKLLPSFKLFNYNFFHPVLGLFNKLVGFAYYFFRGFASHNTTNPTLASAVFKDCCYDTPRLGIIRDRNELKRKFKNFKFPSNIKILIDPVATEEIELLSAHGARHIGHESHASNSNSASRIYKYFGAGSHSKRLQVKTLLDIMLNFNQGARKSKPASTAFSPKAGADWRGTPHKSYITNHTLKASVLGHKIKIAKYLENRKLYMEDNTKYVIESIIISVTSCVAMHVGKPERKFVVRIIDLRSNRSRNFSIYDGDGNITLDKVHYEIMRHAERSLGGKK